MKLNKTISITLACLFGAMMTIFSSCCALTQSCSCENELAGEFPLDGENLEWVNYSVNDTFTFVNQLGDTSVLAIPAETATTHYGDRGDECKSDKFDAIRLTITFNSTFLMNIEIGGSGEIIFFQGTQLGTCFIGSQSCWEENEDDFSGEFMDNLTVGDTEYGQGFQIRTGNDLDYIQWTRNQGIVAFILDNDNW